MNWWRFFITTIMAYTTTIKGIVETRLPFIDPGTLDAFIDEFKMEVYLMLARYLPEQFPDPEDEDFILDDANWTGLRRVLAGKLTAYNMVIRKVIENVGGTAGGAPTGGQKIKKGKADVVEAEFHYAKAGDGSDLMMQATQVAKELKAEICQCAQTLEICLPMCDDGSKGVPTPFISCVPGVD